MDKTPSNWDKIVRFAVPPIVVLTAGVVGWLFIQFQDLATEQHILKDQMLALEEKKSEVKDERLTQKDEIISNLKEKLADRKSTDVGSRSGKNPATKSLTGTGVVAEKIEGDVNVTAPQEQHRAPRRLQKYDRDKQKTSVLNMIKELFAKTGNPNMCIADIFRPNVLGSWLPDVPFEIPWVINQLQRDKFLRIFDQKDLCFEYTPSKNEAK